LSYTTLARINSLIATGTYEANIINTAIYLANLEVKSEILKVGLTPPDSDGTLEAAELHLAMANMIGRRRQDGSIVAATDRSLESQNNINNAIKAHVDDAMRLISAYITATMKTGIASQPYNPEGIPRNDAVAPNFKLHQRAIGGFVPA